jgi:cytochrome c oxidase subunit II
VQRWWSYLFAAVMAAFVGLVMAAPVLGWWLPKNVSSYGGQVDGLFYLILGVTGFFFLLTEGLLILFIYKYAARPAGSEEPVVAAAKAPNSFFRRAVRPITAVIHNPFRLELIWTLVPGAILTLIAVVQVRTWADIKYHSSMPKPSADVQQMQVDGRQFEWRIRYPSVERYLSWKKQPSEKGYEDPARFANHPEREDIWVVNEIHVYRGPANAAGDKGKVLVSLTTSDVIHSFYLPNLRLKQAALPGKTIPVWFKATEANTKYHPSTKHWEDGWDFAHDHADPKHQVWDLVCAELCGWGHYKMRGRLYVHDTEADFLAWLRATEKEQNSHERGDDKVTR